jgi:hypothetical protein
MKYAKQFWGLEDFMNIGQLLPNTGGLGKGKTYA